MAQDERGSTFSAKAPAKVLLTGEHAVVYGSPAIALAVNRFATTTVRSHNEHGFCFTLKDLKSSVRFTLSTLCRVRDRLLSAYRQFIEGKRSIREVLVAPGELFQFTLATVLDICKVELEEGLDIHLHSSIPIGCGMGSSAATVVSLVRALLHHFHIEKGLDWIERLIFDVERLQHGTPSGVDSFISLHGGCAVFQQKNPPRSLEMPQEPLWIVNTGTPDSSTGEAVSLVSKQWKNSSVWHDFEDVARRVERALTSKNIPELSLALSLNQRLLEKIGVVPERVRAFVREIEKRGGTAKISGAGAVRGQTAGILLVLSKEPIEDLCQQYGYERFCIKGERAGASISAL